MRFLSELAGHFRLTWRLFCDARVRWWRRAIFVVPLLYFFIPFRYDVLVDLAPLIGLLDDWLLLLLWTYLFVAICPRSAVRTHRAAILLSHLDPEIRAQAHADQASQETLSPFERFERHRHPREPLALVAGLIILVAVSVLGGVVSVLVLGLCVGLSYFLVGLSQTRIARTATAAGVGSDAQVRAAVERCFSMVPRVPVRVRVVESRSLSAHTFGLDQPYTLVVASRAADELPPEELTALIGHELGHILFEHTFVSSLFGGMLDRMSAAGSLWALVFTRWRRFAELTADRVALLACRDVNVVARMMIKLSLGTTDQQIDVKAALRYACAGEPQAPVRSLEEPLRNHQSLVVRLRALASFDAELFASDVEAWLTTDTTD